MTEAHGTVLHVEDEPGLGELVREALEAQGWAVCWVPTGALGLKALHDVCPQVLLLDHALPDMMGTDFLERARASGVRLPPFIVTTGMGNEQLAVDMMKRGAADYLVKDSHFLAQLATVVRRAAHEAELAQRLAESELQLQFVAQHSPDILAILGADGRARYLSPAVVPITGYAEGERVGVFSDSVHAEDFETVRDWWNRVVANSGGSERATFRLTRKDGGSVWLEAVAQNHLDNPALNGIIVTARDISDRKRAERDRLEMQRQLLHTQKLESLGVLAGGIAHDFNNLLAVIVGNLDLALEELGADSGARTSVELALKATGRARQLTRQMLAYSGRGTFSVETIDLAAVVRENAQIFAVSVSRSVELVTNTAPDTPAIMGSLGQIQQIVMNLLTNASEASGGVGKIVLSTTLRELTPAELGLSLITERPGPGRFACLTVADTGCGMDAAVLERVFDPFFTTKRTGRGLGMAAVLGIVRGHGGALFIDTAVGKGTTVRVCLPAYEAQPVPAPSSGRTADSKLPGRTVLVVDDEPAVRAVAARLLQSAGCSVMEAKDGQEALALVARFPSLDAILMDLTMPNLGGIEAAMRLRESGRHPPVILCSGYGEEGVVCGQASACADAFVEKPFRRADLLAALERVLTQEAGRT